MFPTLLERFWYQLVFPRVQDSCISRVQGSSVSARVQDVSIVSFPTLLGSVSVSVSTSDHIRQLVYTVISVFLPC